MKSLVYLALILMSVSCAKGLEYGNSKSTAVIQNTGSGGVAPAVTSGTPAPTSSDGLFSSPLASPIVLGTPFCETNKNTRPFAGGTGSAADPYLICNQGQFYFIQDEERKYYKLSQSIDLGAAPTIPYFRGNLNCDSHHIINIDNAVFSFVTKAAIVENCNLHLKTTISSEAGLASVNQGTLRTLRISGTLQSQKPTFGGIATLNYGVVDGIVGNIFVTLAGLADNATTESGVGGLVGVNLGQISHVDLSVNAMIYSEGVFGGIVGSNLGVVNLVRIKDSIYQFEMDSSNIMFNHGGIVGIQKGANALIDNADVALIIRGRAPELRTAGLLGRLIGGILRQSHVNLQANLTDYGRIGVLVGYQTGGTIENSWSDGSSLLTTSNPSIAGIVYTQQAGLANKNFSRFNVNSLSAAGIRHKNCRDYFASPEMASYGGICGFSSYWGNQNFGGTGLVTNSFFDNTMINNTLVTANDWGQRVGDTLGSGLTPTDLANQASFTGGWDFGGTWEMVGGQPRLKTNPWD